MKTFLFEIIRWTAAAAAIIFIAISAGGSATVSNADPQTVFEAVSQAADTSSMQNAPNQMIKRLYGIDPSEYEFCKLYYPLTNMDVDELLLIKFSDLSHEQQVNSAIKARLDGQKNVFESYGVGQMELLTNHSIYVSDAGFALFIINGKADEAHAAFDDALRGK